MTVVLGQNERGSGDENAVYLADDARTHAWYIPHILY